MRPTCSLCIYLLQMRELFRWEQGLAFGAEVDREALGQWLARREAIGPRSRTGPACRCRSASGLFDAHDVEAVNAALAPLGLVYGAGLAGADRPTCFLASLAESQAPR